MMEHIDTYSTTREFSILSPHKTIGILGGMGPQATLALQQHIINETEASCDQDHLPVVSVSIPQTPDRTANLLGNGTSPVAHMLNGLHALARGGAKFAVIACNTAHGFIQQLQESSPIPIVSMIEETKRHIHQEYSHVTKVGLLATTGTIKTGVYHDAFADTNISLLVPNEHLQENCVMTAIYGSNLLGIRGIKGGSIGSDEQGRLIEAAYDLINQGAEVLILGCTEIPLALSQKDFPIPLIDPMHIVAKHCVALSKNPYI